MQPLTPILGLIAACAACCAAPLALPLLLGATGLATAAIGLTEIAIGVTAAALLAVLVTVIRRRNCSPDACAMPPRTPS